MKVLSSSSIRPILTAAVFVSVFPGISQAVRADAGHASHGAAGHHHDHEGHSHAALNVEIRSVGQAWGRIQKSLSRIEEKVAAKTLNEVHEQEEVLSHALRWLGESKESLAENRIQRQQAAVKQALALAENLHGAADSGDQARSETELKKLRAALKLVEAQYPKEALVAPPEEEHAHHHGHDHAHHHATAAEPTLKAVARSSAPLKVGEKADVIVRLSKPDGSPALLEDLVESHTEKIHLLIIDPSLTDYHHEHPVPTDVPGEYRFSFTPRKPGSYRIWVDVIPTATKVQEYVITDLESAAPSEPISQRDLVFKGAHKGLTYELSFANKEIRVGDAALGKIRVLQKDGTVFDQLEPVMGAYAHIVGFGEDYRSIAHVHPMGKEPTDPSERGRGDLDFHLLPSHEGLMRLFAQVQIGGEQVFIPFTLQILPAKEAPQTASKGLKEAIGSETLKAILPAYVKVQKALAKDTMEGVKEAAEAIVKGSSASPELAALAQKVAEAPNIIEARKAFRPLSEALVSALTAQSEKLGYFVANCPHAKADWVQADPAILNPYYGKEMLTCGYIKSEQ